MIMFAFAIQRPRRDAIRKALPTALLLAAALTIFLAPPASARHRRPGCAGAITRPGHAPAREIRAAVVCLINDARAAHGLPLLRDNPALGRSAQHWTNAMVAGGYLSHGADVGARISAAGYNWSTVGEVIGAGYGTARQMVKAWMTSPTHCQVILSPAFGAVGAGINRHAVAGFAHRGGTWTADFALAMGAHWPSGNSGPANGCPY
jgi:uncharacterized protein YkwD